MASYRIICTRQEPVANPHSHAHITHVGTGATTAQYDRFWTLTEVLTAMILGDAFFTISPSTGKIAQVHRVKCGQCASDTIRSSADAVTDNNLDFLPRCG